MKIYKHIITHDNIYLLKGNHEQMFIDAYNSSDPYDIEFWKRNNGTNMTRKSLYKENISKNEFYNFCKKLPLIHVIQDKFILAHADIFTGYENINKMSVDELISLQEEDYVLWNRNNIGQARYKDYQFIFGHTPTPLLTNGKKEIYKINNSIYIDCGACFIDGQLSCLRLDDMKEFYVK